MNERNILDNKSDQAPKTTEAGYDERLKDSVLAKEIEKAFDDSVFRGNRPSFISQSTLQQFWEDFYSKCQKNRGEAFFGNSYFEGLDAVMNYLAKNEKKAHFNLQELSEREVKGVMKLANLHP